MKIEIKQSNDNNFSLWVKHENDDTITYQHDINYENLIRLVGMTAKLLNEYNNKP